MAIVPVQPLETLADLTKVTSSASAESASLPFQTMFQNAISDVQDTGTSLDKELAGLATGNSDDLHNIVIASNKATLSVELLVQLRDKALNAYNEIMNMNI